MQLGPIKRLIIHVADMAASKAFYVDTLGFEVAYHFDENWYCLKTGQCELCLSAWRPPSSDGQALRNDEDTIYFEVTDVPAAREALIEKGIEVGEVESVGENAWVAKFRDPDGRMLIIENSE